MFPIHLSPSSQRKKKAKTARKKSWNTGNVFFNRAKRERNRDTGTSKPQKGGKECWPEHEATAFVLGGSGKKKTLEVGRL